MIIRDHGVAESGLAAPSEEHVAAPTRSTLRSAQEKERARIAETIHDHFGLLLMLLRIRLQSLKGHINTLSGDETVSASVQSALAELSAAESVWKELSNAARQLQNDLRPAPLDRLGLTAAFAALQRTFAGAGLAVALDVGGIAESRFNTKLETTAYWLTQHALTNAFRHSGADHATVTADVVQSRGRKFLHIVIEDHGKGFTVGPIGSTFGLSAMYDRAALAGGTVVIDSAPGRGTKVIADLPTDFETTEQERDRELAQRD